MNYTYKVTLLNKDSGVHLEAKILAMKSDTDTGIAIAVTSNNPKMKAHIEKVISTEYYPLSPGVVEKNSATVCVVHVKPDTLEYFYFLPEILGWRGYDVVPFEDAAFMKSIDELGEFLVLKSTDIYNNAKGERIVKHVPKGMIAVHTDGRVVAGGRYLNANIDKDGADWRLEANPHESQSEQERLNARSDHDFGFSDYHPGMDNDLYEKRKDEQDENYHKLTSNYESKGKTLKETYGSTYTDAVDASASITPTETGVPSSMPLSIAEGRLVYSPTLKVAFDSKYWPPKNIEGWEQKDWYIFDYANGDQSDIDSLEALFGPRPEFLYAAKDGIITVESDLDISEGIKIELVDMGASMFSNSEGQVGSIILNQPLDEDFPMEEISSQDFMAKLESVKHTLKKFKSLTSVRTEDGLTIDEEALDALKLSGLKGVHANFMFQPYHYQKAVISALVEPSQYEKFGGPRGYFGHYLHLKYGLGKTAIVLAAEAIMRNKGHFVSGEQVTIITAPTKNIYVWEDEIGKFRNEGAVVIDGSKQQRIEQWEALLDKASSSELPNFVVVAGSKFRMKNETNEEFESDEEVRKELDLDAKYMKLLSIGGVYNTNAVRGGHVACLILDETANYVNPTSSKFKAVDEVTESVYYGNGIVWTLNGDLSGNSAADTISELSFINMNVKKNYKDYVAAYTKKDPNRPHSSARIWDIQNRGLTQFNQRFGHAIYSLDGETIANEKYGLQYTPDIITPIGRNWGGVYMETLDKMEQVVSAKGNKPMKAMGMLSILINSSLGSVAPQRLLEYDLGTNTLMDSVASLLSGEEYYDFKDEVIRYVKATTEENVGYGRTPKERMPITQRDQAYMQYLSETSRNALEKAVELWDNPVLDFVMGEMRSTIKSTRPGKNTKLGFAGFSKRAVKSLYSKLRNEYNEDKVTVYKFDGDTDGGAIKDQQLSHQKETDRHVISLVTGAGLYGLSLAANRGFRFPTWNHAKGGQFEGRFHRNPYQEHLMTVVMPGGVFEYMREVENKKRGIQDQARAELLDITMEDDGELTATSVDPRSLIEKLRSYQPRILGEEGSK